MTRTAIAALWVAWIAAAPGWAGVSAQSAPDDEVQRLNRTGIEHLNARRYREAITSFQAAFDRLKANENIRKNLSTAWLHYGVAHLRANRFSAARRAFAQVVGLGESSPRVEAYRGYVAFKQAQYQEARRLLKGALQRDPTHRDAWVTLGHCHYRLDRLKETVAAWTKANELESSASLAKLIKRVNAELRYTDVSTSGRSRHFRVKIDGSMQGQEMVAASVLETLEGAYNRVCADLGFYPKEVTTVVLYPQRAFRQVMGVHRWVAGTFDGARIRVAVRDYGRYQIQIGRTLFHEYTHMVIHRLAAGAPVPAWLNEGFARLEEGIPPTELEQEVKRLGGAAALWPLEKLDEPFVRIRSAVDARRAYAQSAAFVAYLVSTTNKRRIGTFIKRMRDLPEGGYPAVFRQVFGLDLSEAFARWKRTLG